MADANKIYDDIVKIATAMGLPVSDIRKRTEYERVDWKVGQSTIHISDETVLSYLNSRVLDHITVNAVIELTKTNYKLRREQEQYVYLNLGAANLTNALAKRKENSGVLNYVWNALVAGKQLDADQVSLDSVVTNDIFEKDGYLFVLQDTYITVVNKSGEGYGSACLLDGYSQVNYRSDYIQTLTSSYNAFLKKYMSTRVKKLAMKEVDEAKRNNLLMAIQNVTDFDGKSYHVNGHKVNIDGSNIYLGSCLKVSADGKLVITNLSKDNGIFLELIGIIKDSVVDVDIRSVGYLLDAVKDSTELNSWARGLASIKALNLGGVSTKERKMAQPSTSNTSSDATRKVIDRIVDRTVVVGKQAGLATIADLLVKLVIESIIEISVVRLSGKAKAARKRVLTDIYKDDFQKNIVRCAIVAGLEVLPTTVVEKIPFDVKAVSNVLMVDVSRFIMGEVGQIAAGLGGDILAKAQEAIANIGKSDVAGALTASAASTDNIIQQIVETKEPVAV
jgi:hypothetical protein